MSERSGFLSGFLSSSGFFSSGFLFSSCETPSVFSGIGRLELLLRLLLRRLRVRDRRLDRDEVVVLSFDVRRALHSRTRGPARTARPTSRPVPDDRDRLHLAVLERHTYGDVGGGRNVLVEVGRIEGLGRIRKHHHLLHAGVLGDRHRRDHDVVRELAIGLDVERALLLDALVAP